MPQSPALNWIWHCHNPAISMPVKIYNFYYLTGLLLRETRKDSKQQSNCCSRIPDFKSWMYITADLELSFLFCPCKGLGEMKKKFRREKCDHLHSLLASLSFDPLKKEHQRIGYDVCNQTKHCHPSSMAWALAVTPGNALVLFCFVFVLKCYSGLASHRM